MLWVETVTNTELRDAESYGLHDLHAIRTAIPVTPTPHDWSRQTVTAEARLTDVPSLYTQLLW